MHWVAEESLRCNFVRHNGEILAISQKQLHGAQRYSSFSNDRVRFVLTISKPDSITTSAYRASQLIEGDSGSFASVSRGHCRLFLSVGDQYPGSWMRQVIDISYASGVDIAASII